MKLVIAVALCGLLCIGAVLAQGNDANNNAPAPVVTPATGVAPGAAAAPAPKAGVAKAAVGGTRGYLKTNAETEALWKELGTAQTDLHQKQWELYVLLNAEQVDKQAVRAKYAECRDLNTKLHDVREKLKASWVPLDPKTMLAGHKANKAGANKQGGKKQNGKKGANAQEAKPAAPAATPAAPAGGQ